MPSSKTNPGSVRVRAVSRIPDSQAVNRDEAVSGIRNSRSRAKVVSEIPDSRSRAKAVSRSRDKAANAEMPDE